MALRAPPSPVQPQPEPEVAPPDGQATSPPAPAGQTTSPPAPAGQTTSPPAPAGQATGLPAPGLAYRAYKPEIYRRLEELNLSLPRRGRLDRAALLLDLANLAWRLEALETTAGLVAQLARLDQQLSPSQRLNYLLLATNVKLAQGETAQVRALLLANLPTATADDRLAAALAAVLGDAAETRLPSGKPNAFLLGPRVHENPLALTPRDGRKPGEGGHPEERLLMANAVRRSDATAWRGYWNQYLQGFGLPPLADAAPGGPRNALDTLRFVDCGAPDRRARPRVSVIMASYNSADTLGYAIRSILAQTHGNLELLFCDDGSTDGSLEAAAAIADPRLRIFRSRANQGPYNIRNALIAQASGDFIAFQDADDVSLPNRLADQLAAMEEKSAVASLARWVRLRGDGEVVFFRDGACLRMCVVSLVFRRDLFASFGPYRSTLIGGDTEFAERIRAERGEEQLVQIDKPLVLGLWSDGSLTRTPGTEALADGYRAPARRAYAEIAVRQRLFGRDIVPDAAVDAVLRQHGIFREPRGVERLR